MLTLHQLFRDKLIPWAEDNLEQRLVLAKPVMKRSQLPSGVEISKKEFIGKRVPVQNRRFDGTRLFYAEWPEDGLHELTAPRIVCVIKGTTDYTAGKYIITCGEGHFILLPPLVPNLSGGRSHLEGERRKNGYCELFQVQVAQDYVQCMFCVSEGEMVTDIVELACFIYNRQAVRLFQDFLRLAEEEEDHSPQLLQHLLAAFFWVVYNEIKSEREIYLIFKNQQIPSPTNGINELKQYIKENLRYSLTIEKMAKHLHISPRQLTRYVRRETGQSFLDLLNTCRIEESKRYLTETRWTVEAITFLIGFKSSTHFNAFFRRHEGCTPGTYRRKIIQQDML